MNSESQSAPVIAIVIRRPPHCVLRCYEPWERPGGAFGKPPHYVLRCYEPWERPGGSCASLRAGERGLVVHQQVQLDWLELGQHLRVVDDRQKFTDRAGGCNPSEFDRSMQH